MALSSLRPTPALEEPGSRITAAVGERGGYRICLYFSFRAFRFTRKGYAAAVGSFRKRPGSA